MHLNYIFNLRVIIKKKKTSAHLYFFTPSSNVNTSTDSVGVQKTIKADSVDLCKTNGLGELAPGWDCNLWVRLSLMWCRVVQYGALCEEWE